MESGNEVISDIYHGVSIPRKVVEVGSREDGGEKWG